MHVVSFITDLLRWLRALQWTDELGTVTFKLALDFEEFAERTLPAAPHAKFRGHTLPLQERARVLRLALCTLQRLVKSGTLHPAKVITRLAALVPMWGPALAGLNRKPYFACRSAMIPHMEQLARYCESTWTLRTHARTHAQRLYVYRVRCTAEEVEEARLQRALAGSLNTGLMPSSSLCAKGGEVRHFCERPVSDHRVRPCPTSAIFGHHSPHGGDQRTYASHTRAANTLTMPSALLAGVFHMQEAKNPGSAMLQQRTPQPGAHRPAPAFENMRPSWTSALPSLRTHAERRTALLCPRAPQSVHTSQQHHPKAHIDANACAPQAPHITLWCAHHTSHSHRQSPSNGDPRPSSPIAYGRPAAGNVGRRRDGRGSPPVWTGAWKGNTGNNIRKAHAQR